MTKLIVAGYERIFQDITFDGGRYYISDVVIRLGRRD